MTGWIPPIKNTPEQAVLIQNKRESVLQNAKLRHTGVSADALKAVIKDNCDFSQRGKHCNNSCDTEECVLDGIQ